MSTRITAANGQELNKFDNFQKMISAIRSDGVEPDHFHGTIGDELLHGKFYEAPFEVGFIGSTLVTDLNPTDFDSLVADSE